MTAEGPAATLWIVATPIGNLDDLSRRAIRTLSQVALIAAEDTRHSRRLTEAAGIATPMMSLHEHNESARVERVLGRLAAGEDVALISDAGTPLISDPGFVLVRAVRAAGHPVQTVPGPCAAVAALSIAGLASDRFVFEGFLPARPSARRRRLGELVEEPRTLIVYESSHRIAATAADLAATFGSERLLTLCRELTKRHEQSVMLSAGELGDWLAADDNRCRGEFVLVIAGHPEPPTQGEAIALDPLLEELLALGGTKQAAKAAARLTGVATKTAYERALEIAGRR